VEAREGIVAEAGGGRGMCVGEWRKMCKFVIHKGVTKKVMGGEFEGCDEE